MQIINGLFVKAINILTTEKDEIAANFLTINEKFSSKEELETEQLWFQKKLNVVVGLMQQCVSESAHVVLNQKIPSKV